MRIGVGTAKIYVRIAPSQSDKSQILRRQYHSLRDETIQGRAGMQQQIGLGLAVLLGAVAAISTAMLRTRATIFQRWFWLQPRYWLVMACGGRDAR